MRLLQVPALMPAGSALPPQPPTSPHVLQAAVTYPPPHTHTPIPPPPPRAPSPALTGLPGSRSPACCRALFQAPCRRGCRPVGARNNARDTQNRKRWESARARGPGTRCRGAAALLRLTSCCAACHDTQGTCCPWGACQGPPPPRRAASARCLCLILLHPHHHRQLLEARRRNLHPAHPSSNPSPSHPTPPAGSPPASAPLLLPPASWPAPGRSA